MPRVFLILAVDNPGCIYSERSPSRIRVRAASIDATSAAAMPTAKTIAKINASEPQGTSAPVLDRCGIIATSAAMVPVAKPQTKSTPVSTSTSQARLKAPESQRTEQGQFAATFQDVADHHGGQSQGSQE